jgi:hypothetical protein
MTPATINPASRSHCPSALARFDVGRGKADCTIRGMAVDVEQLRFRRIARREDKERDSLRAGARAQAAQSEQNLGSFRSIHFTECELDMTQRETSHWAVRGGGEFV